MYVPTVQSGSQQIDSSWKIDNMYLRPPNVIGKELYRRILIAASPTAQMVTSRMLTRKLEQKMELAMKLHCSWMIWMSSQSS